MLCFILRIILHSTRDLLGMFLLYTLYIFNTKEYFSHYFVIRIALRDTLIVHGSISDFFQVDFYWKNKIIYVLIYNILYNGSTDNLKKFSISKISVNPVGCISIQGHVFGWSENLRKLIGQNASKYLISTESKPLNFTVKIKKVLFIGFKLAYLHISEMLIYHHRFRSSAIILIKLIFLAVEIAFRKIKNGE